MRIGLFYQIQVPKPWTLNLSLFVGGQSGQST
jgi:hypothetical protein